MIKPNKKIGVVYSGNSELYKDEFEAIVSRKREEGYCIDTIVVDNKLSSKEQQMEDRVFNQLDESDYGIVFLSRDLELKVIGENKNEKDDKALHGAKPNVLLEFGYLRSRVGKNNLWCVIDFPYKEIENGTYMMPSDSMGRYMREIDRNNYEADLRNIVDLFIDSYKDDIVKMDNYNANDVIGSLILNKNYKTDYDNIFSESQFKVIEKYSIECQMEEIFNIWKQEKEKLSGVEAIMYLFERIVFLPFFPIDFRIEKLNELFRININQRSSYIDSCRQILKTINEYEEFKGRNEKYIVAGFYEDKMKKLQEEFEKIKNLGIAPIIECVTRNYIGLCQWNYNVNIKMAERRIDINTLKEAKRNFEKVIKLSDEHFSNTVEIFKSFAYYNLARVKWELKDEADWNFTSAIEIRRRLASAKLTLPKIFRLNFNLEKICAEISLMDYFKEKGLIDSESCSKKIGILIKELNDMGQTPVGNVSLFKTLKERLEERRNANLGT